MSIKFLTFSISVPLVLTSGAIAAFLYSYFGAQEKEAIYWIQVSYTLSTLLIAWLAVFGFLIVDEVRKPRINLRFSYDKSEYYKSQGRSNWFLSLTIENTGSSPARNAIVKCCSIAPPPLESIQSSNVQPLSPIPLKWAYWDAYKAMYGDYEGPKRSLHRTIYRRDTCGFIEIKRSSEMRGTESAELQFVIYPNSEAWQLKKNTEYAIELLIEADNLLSEKTWKFKIKWNGSFPESHNELSTCVVVAQ